MADLRVSGLDESFGHQLVAPRLQTEHMTPRWAERTYYLLHVDETLTINAGRQLYPHDGRWSVFAATATPAVQRSLRAQPPYAPGDDPDMPAVGPLRVEVVKPLEEIRLVLDDPSCDFGYDLTFRSRYEPCAHEPTFIERDGDVVTHTMSFFQSGLFSGVVSVDGSDRTVTDRAGFRDRSWGFRKHDGSPRRGLVVFAACECDDCSIYVLLHETASGRRAYTGGWLMTADGIVDTVRSADHDLVFVDNLLESGRLDLEMASGDARVLTFRVENRLYLSGVGYSPDPERRAPGYDVYDLSDAAVLANIDGQNDNGCRFSLDGAAGYGYVETGLGTHATYRPEQP
jgi:hypothetical protein